MIFNIQLRNTELNHSSNDTESKKTTEISLFDSHNNEYQKVEIVDDYFVTFCSGILTHEFQFKSVYTHKNNNGKSEATTFQNKWLNVDFIFHSNIEPLEKYTLLSDEECSSFLSTIPNSVVGSDHLCLGSTFLLLKQR